MSCVDGGSFVVLHQATCREAKPADKTAFDQEIMEKPMFENSESIKLENSHTPVTNNKEGLSSNQETSDKVISQGLDQNTGHDTHPTETGSKESCKECEKNTKTVCLSSRCKAFLLKIPALGILCGLTSGIFFATASVSVKLVTSISPMEILMIRSVFEVVVFLPVVLYTKKPVLGLSGERLMLFLRAFLGTISSAFSYYAFRMIPLGDATTIVFASPVLVSIFACTFLKESCSILQTAAVTVSLVGVLFISKPSFMFGDNVQRGVSSSQHIRGITMACISCLSGALAIVCLRKLVRTPSTVIVLTFSLFTVFSGLVVAAVQYELKLPKMWTEFAMLLGVGVCGACGQFLMTLALKFENAGPVSVARTIDIVIAYVFQVTILQEHTSWMSVLGAVLVCSCIMVTAMHKWRDGNKSRALQIIENLFKCKKQHQGSQAPK